MKRALPTVLLACVVLAACEGPPPSYARSASLGAPPPAPVAAPVVAPAPISTPMTLNLADFMYGPPPHNRIDPRMRCRFDCPKYPADLPPPVAPAR